MTPLEIIFTIILWIITGLWICYKREWYKHKALNDINSPAYNDFETCLATVTFAPIALIIALFRVFLIGKWK